MSTGLSFTRLQNAHTFGGCFLRLNVDGASCDQKVQTGQHIAGVLDHTVQIFHWSAFAVHVGEEVLQVHQLINDLELDQRQVHVD